MIKSVKQGRSKHANVTLVDRLWNLKRLCETHFALHIPLNLLLKDDDYREELLEKALELKDTTLTQLVWEIRQLEDESISEHKPVDGKKLSTKSKKRFWLKLTPVASVVFGLLVFISGYIAGTAALIGSDLFAPAHAVVALESVPATTGIPDIPSDKPLFRLHGSNTVGERLAPRLVTAYLTEKGVTHITSVAGETPVEKTIRGLLHGKEISVEIHAHGSSTAFEGLRNQSADIGMSSRRIKEQERNSLQPLLGDLSSSGSEHVIGLDGLAIITHPGNPVNSLSLQQLVAIFSGEVTDWSQIGGKKMPIHVYARDENSGTWDTFKSLVLDAGKATLVEDAKRYESSSGLSDDVAKDPGAIGFIGLPYVRQAKLLAISESDEHMAIIPTHFTVGTEDYPLARRLYFYTPQNDANLFAREFATFSVQESARDIVEKIGLVSQNIKTGKPFAKDFYPPLVRDLTTHSERLSINFRFKSGSDELDSKSLRDIDRLVKYLEEHAPKRAQLFGFSDSEGDDISSQELSLRRARVVEQALIARGVYPLLTKGLGDAAPLASSETESGRNINRRVEVWIL
jgi:phosphate transport system substrate-binding protein